MSRVILNIRGLNCGDSVAHLANSLKATTGVNDVAVDLMSRSACVEHDSTVCKVRDLISAVLRVGMQVDGYGSPDTDC